MTGWSARAGSSTRDVETVDAQAHAVTVRIAEVEGVGGAVFHRHPRGTEALLPLVQAVDRKGQDVSRAGLRPGTLELPLEHQHRGPRGEPDREQRARVLLEAPQLAEAEKARARSTSLTRRARWWITERPYFT